MSIGEIIRARRRALNITQAQLAKMLGVTSPMIHMMEKGIRGVSLAKATALSGILGIPADVFLGIASGPATDSTPDVIGLRDYFAARASEDDIDAYRVYGAGDVTREEAKFAYADAMLAARQK